MTESILKLSEVKLALKRKGLNYKLKNLDLNGTEESLIFADIAKGTQVCGKILRSFTEGEMYHWPLLNHENLAPLLDVLYIRDFLYIYLTIDEQITLRKIVHDENFVYDPRCFDRKRLYARGIFSGLNYLHGKSLCLMNLCDDNIVISKCFDRAIITNFSHLVCSQKTTKSKLNLPEVYKAPETEKGEFDAIAAEIWASGTLMLDIFLAHMVPWAIVDYKPKRVLDLVDTLSLELLQAANVGSIVSAIELEKFKTFLKCFFKQNPLARITARYATIASFLQMKLKPSLKVLSEAAFLGTNVPPQKIYREKLYSPCHSQPMPQQNPSSKKYLDYFQIRQPKKNLKPKLQQTCDFKVPLLTPTSPGKKQSENANKSVPIDVSPVVPHYLTENEQTGETQDEVGVSQARISINITKQQQENSSAQIPTPFLYSNDDPFIISGAAVGFKKMSRSYQTVEQETDALTESGYNCYQSKSLSFIKSETNNANTTLSFRFCSNRTLSYSNVKLSSLKYSNEAEDSDTEDSDLCLNRLFSDSHSPKTTFHRPNFLPSKSIETFNVPQKPQTMKHTKCESRRFIEQPVRRRVPTTGEISSNLCSYSLQNKSGIRDIIDNIIFLRKCYYSIQMHLKRHISSDFSQRQLKLLNEYRTLLRQENLQLRDTLRTKYELTLEDIINIIKFRLKHNEGSNIMNETGSSAQNPYKIRQNRFLETKKAKETMKGDISNVRPSIDHKFKDDAILRSRRKNSYFNAIEMSEKNLDKKWELMGNLGNEQTTIKHRDMVTVRGNNPTDKRIKKPAEKDRKDNTIPRCGNLKKNTPVFDLESNLCGKRTEISTEIDRKTSEVPYSENLKNKEVRQRKHSYTKAVKDDEKKIDKYLPKNKERNKQKIEKRKEDIGKKTKEEKNIKKEKSNKKKEKSDKKEEKKENNEKKWLNFAELGKPRRSFFTSLCPGGKAEATTPILDTLCEACKFNLEAI